MTDAPAPRSPLALLGGTFDPVHYGHLRLAEDVRRALAPIDVQLVPACDPPHRGAPHAPADDRLAMLELARGEFPELSIDRREIDRRGRSYTVLTLEALRAEDPARPLAWIVGADAFLGLPTWHRWREIFDLAHLIVVARPGVSLASGLPAALLPEWNARHRPSPEILRARPGGTIYVQGISPQPISATAIRAALARGDHAAVRGLLPESVLAYIRHNRLYRGTSSVQDAT